MPKTYTLSVALILCFLSATVLQSDDTRSGVISIESIMKETHEGDDSLANKAVRGEANEKEIHELIAVYRALYHLEPPRGKTKPWQKRIAKVVKAAESLQEDGDLRDTDQLAKVMDCKACHKTFQTKDKFNKQ